MPRPCHIAPNEGGWVERPPSSARPPGQWRVRLRSWDTVTYGPSARAPDRGADPDRRLDTARSLELHGVGFAIDALTSCEARRPTRPRKICPR